MLRVHYDRTSENTEGDFDVILLKSLKKGKEPVDEVVAIDRARHDAIQDVKRKLKEELSSHKDSELQLAVLAELVDEFLTERVAPSEKKKTKSGRKKIRKVENG